MPMRFTVETPKNNQAGRLALIAALIFGVLGFAAGSSWLSTGSIVIRGGNVRSGPAQSLRAPAPASETQVAGTIRASNVLFYPLCLAWIALGVTMAALALISFFSSTVLYHRLSAWSCLAFLLLAFGTVGAAILSGP